MISLRGPGLWGGLFVLLCSCGEGAPTLGDAAASDSPQEPLGGSCSEDGDCLSGLCFENQLEPSYCSAPCTPGGTECEGLTCGTREDGTHVCMKRCEDRVPDGYSCVGDAPVHCAHLDDTHCGNCGCKRRGELCGENGCFRQSEVGQPCENDFFCLSGHCSPRFKVCRVPRGSPCTSNNCDRCLTGYDWSFCSSECPSGAGCGGSGECVFSNSVYFCEPKCGRTCPDRCETADDGTEYCACDTCQVTYAKGENGLGCRVGGQCASDWCDRVSEGCDYLGRCEDSGMCTQSCVSSAECGDGAFCQTISGGVSGQCMPSCAGMSCSLGTCNAFPTTESTTEMLCDLRQVAGEPCHDASNCIFGACTADGKCRGNALFGAACASDLDCANGYCCGGFCRTACSP